MFNAIKGGTNGISKLVLYLAALAVDAAGAAAGAAGAAGL
jgi:hypothetical protein